VTNHFLYSLCNCDNYCIEVKNVTTCFSNNTFIITTVAIKGKQALNLQNQTYTKLQKANRTIEFESNVYYVFCVTTALCGDVLASSKNSTVSSTSKIKDKDSVPVIQLLIILFALILVMTITLLLLLIVIWALCGKKDLSSQGKSRLHPSAVVVDKQCRNGVTDNDLPNSSLHTTNAHNYEKVDVPEISVTNLNPSYHEWNINDDNCGNNSVNDNTEAPQTDILQISNNSQVIDINTTYNKSTLIHSKSNEVATTDSAEIKWVNNPNYLSVSKCYALKKTQPPNEAIDETCSEEMSKDTCKSLLILQSASGTESTTVSENSKFDVTSTWDKDRSSYVTGHSPQFKIPARSLSITTSINRDFENEASLNIITAPLPIPHVVCSSTDV